MKFEGAGFSLWLQIFSNPTYCSSQPWPTELKRQWPSLALPPSPQLTPRQLCSFPLLPDPHGPSDRVALHPTWLRHLSKNHPRPSQMSTHVLSHRITGLNKLCCFWGFSPLVISWLKQTTLVTWLEYTSQFSAASNHNTIDIWDG